MNFVWTDLLPTVGLLGAVALPFLAERFWFGISYGPFAWILGVFAAQWAVIYLGMLVHSLVEPTSGLAQASLAFAAFAWVTIGVIPFIVLPVALGISVLVICWLWMTGRRPTKNGSIS